MLPSRSFQSIGATVESMNLLSSIKTSGPLWMRLLWMCSVSRHFFYPFSVYDGGLSLSKSVRNPTNAYESARKLPSFSDKS